MNMSHTHPYAPPDLRLADLVREGLPELNAQYGTALTSAHRHALRAILGCRTGAFGERVLHCPQCNQYLHSPRSCGHRSCPRCQHHATSAWLARQQARLLPVSYFMATFVVKQHTAGGTASSSVAAAARGVRRVVCRDG